MEVSVIGKGSFLQLVRRGTYEFTERVSGQNAVYIIATDQNGDLILIWNHRYPFDAEVLEFPAGLIDDGELTALTGIREMQEETGYLPADNAVVESTHPMTTSLSGITNEMIQPIIISEVEYHEDGQRLDDMEKIRVVRMPKKGLLKRLQQMGNNGKLISSRLYAYALGMEASND